VIKAATLVMAAAVVALLAAACGGSGDDDSPAPATEAPATEQSSATEAATEAAATDTPATTEAATATEPPATDTPSPQAATTPDEPAESEEPAVTEDGEVPLQIVTLLPPDAIPAINNPRFITAEEADGQLRLTDLVIGVSVDGEHRAYGAAFLSAHEIVNDTLGGRAIAVTW